MFLKNNTLKRQEARQVLDDCNTILDSANCEMKKIAENGKAELRLVDKESHDVE